MTFEALSLFRRVGPVLAGLLAAGAALGGCATYAPEPLAKGKDSALVQPDLRGLAARAGRLRHPRLAPAAIDLGRPLTPEALGLIAVVANPDLKAARAKAGVADGQAFDAGLLPDPVINLSYDDKFAGPDPFNGWGAQVIYELTALRDHAAVLAAARASRDQVRLDLAWQEWQTAGQARLLAARIAGLEQALAIEQASRASADAALGRALSEDGDLKADDVTARRLAAADAGDKANQTQKDLEAARRDLNRLLGLPPQAVLSIAAPAAPADAALDADALFARAEAERLDLAALKAGYASQEAAVRKAVLDQFPSLQLTVNRAQDTTGNQTIGPAVNFTLPLWNRNQGGVAIARATREQLRAEYDARLFATRADIADLTSALALERRQRAAIVAQAAALERTAAASETAAGRGDVARTAAQAARQTAADKAVALAGLDQAIAEQTVALELAVGAPLQP
ncbi:MAG: TolC family protein [Caulobacteraceae bacterium]|nr:TolC family protein [Caulobacteraceae bacterium]